MPSKNPLRHTVTRSLVVLATLTLPTTLQARSQDTDGRPTIGLALGGGAAKGFAHIGILEWFEENRIPIDYLGGTSAGGFGDPRPHQERRLGPPLSG